MTTTGYSLPWLSCERKWHRKFQLVHSLRWVCHIADSLCIRKFYNQMLPFRSMERSPISPLKTLLVVVVFRLHHLISHPEDAAAEGDFIFARSEDSSAACGCLLRTSSSGFGSPPKGQNLDIIHGVSE